MSPTFTSTCDWGDCDKPAFAWRFDAALGEWLAVCKEHFIEGTGTKDPTVTPTEVEDLYNAQQEARP